MEMSYTPLKKFWYSWKNSFSSVQLLSHVWLCDPMNCSTPGPPSITNSQNLLKLKSIELVMPSNHLILCHPLLLPSIFPNIRVFSNELALCIRWPKYWSFMTTGKTITLTIQILVSKIMSLLFNMLPRFVTVFLPRRKHRLISRLQSLSLVNLDPKEIKSVTVSIVSLSICHEVMGPDAMILVFWMLSFKLAFSLSSFTFISRFIKDRILGINICGKNYIWKVLCKICFK